MFLAGLSVKHRGKPTYFGRGVAHPGIYKPLCVRVAELLCSLALLDSGAVLVLASQERIAGNRRMVVPSSNRYRLTSFMSWMSWMCWMCVVLVHVRTVQGFASYMTSKHCNRTLEVGVRIMSKEAEADSSRRIIVFRGSEVVENGTYARMHVRIMHTSPDPSVGLVPLPLPCYCLNCLFLC
jgi:hypothetical protein